MITGLEIAAPSFLIGMVVMFLIIDIKRYVRKRGE
jgi:hypothetical protein